MIAHVRGRVASRGADHVVVDCDGVGYRLAASAQTLRHVGAPGAEVTLHSHLIVRDDALALYGFASERERELFLMLLSVQSVGPKVALAVLSGGPAEDLLLALATGDAARLESVPGVGKRTAQRIVVELRDKAGVAERDGDWAGGVGGAPITVTRADDPRLLARAGLLELGYEPGEAQRLLDGAEGDTPQALIAAALRAARVGGASA